MTADQLVEDFGYDACTEQAWTNMTMAKVMQQPLCVGYSQRPQWETSNKNMP